MIKQWRPQYPVGLYGDQTGKRHPWCHIYWNLQLSSWDTAGIHHFKRWLFLDYSSAFTYVRCPAEKGFNMLLSIIHFIVLMAPLMPAWIGNFISLHWAYGYFSMVESKSIHVSWRVVCYHDYIMKKSRGIRYFTLDYSNVPYFNVEKIMSDTLYIEYCIDSGFELDTRTSFWCIFPDLPGHVGINHNITRVIT